MRQPLWCLSVATAVRKGSGVQRQHKLHICRRSNRGPVTNKWRLYGIESDPVDFRFGSKAPSEMFRERTFKSKAMIISSSNGQRQELAPKPRPTRNSSRLAANESRNGLTYSSQPATQTPPHHELPFAKVQSTFCRNPKTHAAVPSPKNSGGFEINGV